ncbi:MAG: aminotransferase class V-fold PLP-dependent enzyme [Eubacteriales bacterium]|nr:aminotransferase class V-fold PLP-dependent enzyme [Eubacteriales bacterium]
MLYFECDYDTGAHEKILKRLAETNMEPLAGYGCDRYCESAREKIRRACACPEAKVFFLAGGTQTNAVVIRTLLKPYEGVVAASTGHIGVHEAGAVEFTGHKVLELPQHEGKILAEELAQYIENFFEDENHEHMVFPGMVYLSHPTEYGTLYTKEELKKISEVCRNYQIPLYLDGARLGYGLAAEETDVTLPVLAEYCDAFYIGGTKVGALCGEAVVFPRRAPKYFMTMAKQHGAMMAKGRLLGIQFDVLFTDGLYMEISRHAIRMAMLMKEGMKKRGCRFLLDSPTNQQFLVLENGEMEKLKEKVVFSFWEKVDDSHTAVRFATSWATQERDVRELLELF